MSSSAIQDLSPQKVRNMNESSHRGGTLRLNAGEILNNSNLMHNFMTESNSPVKANHRRNNTDLPFSSKAGAEQNIQNLRSSFSGERKMIDNRLNNTIGGGPMYQVSVQQIVDHSLGKKAFGIDNYKIPRNEKLLIASKSYSVSKQKLKNFAEIEAQNKSFVPAPTQYNPTI